MIKPLTELVLSDRLGSWAGTAFFTFWIAQRFYFSYSQTFLWWLITFQFTLFVLAYLTRGDARIHARGSKEIIFPFICAAMPFALDDYPFKPAGRTLAGLEPLSGGLMIAGTLLIVFGVFYLRRSFSIMVEVREPVLNGIYRWCRHPMYLGSMLASLGMVLYRFSILNVIIFCAFCGLQVHRAGLEERKIREAFPQYGEYASRVGWLGRVGRR